MIAQDSLDSEQVEAIAYRDHSGKFLLFEKLDTFFKAVNGRGTVRFHKDAISRNVLFLQIGFAHSGLRKALIQAEPSRGQYSIGHVSSKQICGVVEPCSEHG